MQEDVEVFTDEGVGTALMFQTRRILLIDPDWILQRVGGCFSPQGMVYLSRPQLFV
jgi:hypothetical protein